jgi:cell envelope opacity-associated protein A
MITQEHKDLIKTSVVEKLRKGQAINIVDKERGYIHHIQINKKEKNVCFERWVKCIGAH